MVKKDAGPDFLKAEDLVKDGKWAEFRLRIKAVHEPGTVQASDKSFIDGWVIEFEGTKKRFILSSSVNQRIMKYATGHSTDECDRWVGKSITLQPRVGNWFGEKNVTAIRVTLPEGQPKPFVQRSAMGEKITGQPFGEQVK